MASKIEVDEIFNAGGDNDTGIDLATNDVVKVKIAGSEKARVDSSGRLLLGRDASDGVATNRLQIEAQDGEAGISIHRGSASSGGGGIFFSKSRGASAGDDTVVNSGDEIGKLFFAGADGTDRATPAAQISVEVDGTPGGNDMPGRILFGTTADGASSVTERVRITSTGNVLFGTTSGTISTSGFGAAIAADGSGGFGFSRNVNYASAVMQIFGNGGEFRLMGDGAAKNTGNSYGAISDLKLKENIADSGSQWDDIKAVKVKKYSLKTDKVDKANMLGVIAQDLEASDMGGLVSDFEHEDEKGEKTGEKTKTVKYSILYMKAVKALQEAMARIETLETKVAALESK